MCLDKTFISMRPASMRRVLGFVVVVVGVMFRRHHRHERFAGFSC